MKKMKIVVLLMNLGGPDSLGNVKKFLFNLFNDKYIIRLPKFFRYLLAKTISITRNKKSQKIYELIGGGSPILKETNDQIDKLNIELKSEFPEHEFYVMPLMRHFYPKIEDKTKEIHEINPDKILLLPLYPQFSTTTTLSSVEEIMEKLNNDPRIKVSCCYFNNENFIKSHCDVILENIKNIDYKKYRFLFSAHSLPQKIIDAGDPYSYQIEKSVKLIVDGLKLEDLDYKITYQSKVGPIKWLLPQTEDEILKCCEENLNIVIIPVAFVSEHVETLVELDIEYKEIADNYKIDYIRISTLRCNKYFIASLVDNIGLLIKSDKVIEPKDSFCVKNYKMCICNIIK